MLARPISFLPLLPFDTMADPITELMIAPLIEPPAKHDIHYQPPPAKHTDNNHIHYLPPSPPASPKQTPAELPKPTPASRLAGFTITRAQAKHIPMLQHFVASTLHTTFSMAFFLPYLYTSSHFLLIMSRQVPGGAPHQTEIIGVAAGFLDPKSRRHRSSWFHTVAAYVSILAVDPGFRHLGVATRLLRALEARLAQDALCSSMANSTVDCGSAAILESVVLDVECDNKAAQQFYKSQGFFFSSVAKRGYYRNTTGKSAIEMKKMLVG